jgi:hypothetical protein
MAVKEIYGGWFADDSMRDGYLAVDAPKGPRAGGFRTFRLTRDTFDTLSWRDMIAEACDFGDAVDPGEYLIPMSIIAGDQRREVEMALDFLEPVESDMCTLPTCIHATVSYERGFPLCAEHAEVMRDWDSLVQP